MKKVITLLKNHIREDFSPWVYGLTFLVLGTSIGINYIFDFEDVVLDAQENLMRVVTYFLFYCVAYFSVLLLYSAFTPNKQFWSARGFWLRSLVILIVLSFDSGRPFLQSFVDDVFPDELAYYGYKILVNLYSLVMVMIPLIVLYYALDRGAGHRYGLRTANTDLKPYWLLLACMLPLILAASFTDGFQRQYPMYKESGAADYLDQPGWLLAMGYELVYGADFITVEFLFRGALVLALMPFTGRGSVLAMASVYCFLHFGKPAGEAISSIFGGYILGVIAYETRTVFGGIIVHVGIAWSMEMMAWLQHL